MMSPSGEVYSAYSIGPSTDPRGSPRCKSLVIDLTPSITTHCCDDKFSLATLEFSEKRTNGGISSVDATRLARTETRHDSLVHGDLLRAGLYGRQG